MYINVMGYSRYISRFSHYKYDSQSNVLIICSSLISSHHTSLPTSESDDEHLPLKVEEEGKSQEDGIQDVFPSLENILEEIEDEESEEVEEGEESEGLEKDGEDDNQEGNM